MTTASLTIAEAAERSGLTTHTLRYYERDGLMLEVGRAGSGHRRYTEQDLGWIELITKLRRTGMPIREIRRYAQLVRDGEDNLRERLDLLVAHRDRVRQELAEVTRHLAAIDAKIDHYANAVGTTDPDLALSAPRRVGDAGRG